MQSKSFSTILGVLAVAGVFALAACGSSDDKGDSGTGGGGGNAAGAGGTGGSGGTAGGAGGQGGKGGTGGGSGGAAGGGGAAGTDATFGGCMGMFFDSTMATMVAVNFGASNGLMYKPKCLKVKKNTMVIFSGDFSMHPLAGAATNATDDVPRDPTKAINKDFMKPITFATTGYFGYYCTAHGTATGGGMSGNVWVVE